MHIINKKTLGIDLCHYDKALGVAVDVMYITDMYEAYCTYVDDKYFDNYDYDDDTDADTDNDTGDDTDDEINTHIIVWSIKEN